MRNQLVEEEKMEFKHYELQPFTGTKTENKPAQLRHPTFNWNKKVLN